jgi:hypothetical protein
MRIQALAIFAIGTVSIIGPAAAQMYDPAYPVCLQVYGRGAPITIATTRRCLSATRRHRASRHSALSIHISRARKCRGVIGGIANRDRGEPRGSSPPTPPDIRVRIRRFAGLCMSQLCDGSQAE